MAKQPTFWQNFQRLLLIVMGVILLIIFFQWQCNRGKKTTKDTPVETTKSQSDKRDSILVRDHRFEDSVASLIRIQRDSIEFMKLAVRESAADYDYIAGKLRAKVNKPPVSNDYTDGVKRDVDDLIAAGEKKDTACAKEINHLENESKLKDVLIDRKKKTVDSLSERITVALNVQDTLQKQKDDWERKAKPHNKLYVGLNANVKPYFGYGANAGFIFKNGTIIEVQVQHINIPLIPVKEFYQVGIKQVISLRKR